MAEAVRQVTEYLRQVQPPLLEWKPDEKYLAEKLLNGPGSPGPDVNIDNPQKAKSWVLRLKSPGSGGVQQAQPTGTRRIACGPSGSQLSQERLHVTAWVLLGVLVVLATGSIYARLRTP